MRNYKKHLLPALIVSACLALCSCSGYAVGFARWEPLSYMYGLPIGFVPYNGYWHDDYCYDDGYWHYHGMDTPYESCWPDRAYNY